MPIAAIPSTPSAQAIDLCGPVLDFLTHSPGRHRLCEVRDGVGAFTFETFVALRLLIARKLVDSEHVHFVGYTYAATKQAVQP